MADDRLSETLQTLVRAQTDIACSAHDPRLVMQLAVDYTPMLAAASGSMLERLDGDMLEARAASGVLGASLGERRALAGTLAEKAIDMGSASLDESGMQLAVALVHEGDPLGALTLQTEEQRGFQPAQVHAVELLATLLGVCLKPEPRGRGHGSSELLHRAAVAALPDGVVVLDANMTILTANAAASRLAGRPVSWLEGSGVGDSSWGVVASDGEPLAPQDHPAARALRTGETHADEILGVRRPDGTLAWLLVSAEPLLDASGVAAQVVVHLRDLAQHERRTDRDILTGLPTHRQILADLVAALARARRTQRAVGLISLDFDNFKALNARYGHEAGDRVLKQAGERVIHVLRAGELCARYGEDELAILLPDLGAAGHGDARSLLDLVAERMTVGFREPFELGAEKAPLGVSVGTALFPHDAEDLDGLLTKLDRSLQAHKRSKEG